MIFEMADTIKPEATSSIVSLVRLLQQCSKGRGDYTKEKYASPDPSFAELDAELKRILAADTVEGKP